MQILTEKMSLKFSSDHHKRTVLKISRYIIRTEPNGTYVSHLRAVFALRINGEIYISRQFCIRIQTGHKGPSPIPHLKPAEHMPFEVYRTPYSLKAWNDKIKNKSAGRNHLAWVIITSEKIILLITKGMWRYVCEMKRDFFLSYFYFAFSNPSFKHPSLYIYNK